MVELGDDAVIIARARLAEKMALVIQRDPRVRRWLRVEFAPDGGTQVVIELRDNRSRIGGEVIARELEFAVARALPALPWVRVQVT
jgi:hypothetical protein